MFFWTTGQVIYSDNLVQQPKKSNLAPVGLQVQVQIVTKYSATSQPAPSLTSLQINLFEFGFNQSFWKTAAGFSVISLLYFLQWPVAKTFDIGGLSKPHGSCSRTIKQAEYKIKESIGFVFTQRHDILRARGRIHIEKVIMASVWFKDGDWNSIRNVSHWVLSTSEH